MKIDLSSAEIIYLQCLMEQRVEMETETFGEIKDSYYNIQYKNINEKFNHAIEEDHNNIKKLYEELDGFEDCIKRFIDVEKIIDSNFQEDVLSK